MHTLLHIGYMGLVAVVWQAFIPLRLPDKYTPAIVCLWLVWRVIKSSYAV